MIQRRENEEAKRKGKDETIKGNAAQPQNEGAIIMRQSMKWVSLLSKCPDHQCFVQGNRPLQSAEEKRMRLASARN